MENNVSLVRSDELSQGVSVAFWVLEVLRDIRRLAETDRPVTQYLRRLDLNESHERLQAWMS